MDLDRKLISRAGIAGFGLSLFGIGLFVLIWVLMGEAGANNFTRVVLSVCVPPALMAAMVGVYMLLVRPANGSDQGSEDDEK